MERAGIDIVTDGEIRRESYSNRFALALDGVDADNPGRGHGAAGAPTAVPRVVGPIRRRAPVEVRDAAVPARQYRPGDQDHPARARSPCRARPRTSSTGTKTSWRWTTPWRSTQELRELKAAGVDVVQLDEPWVRTAPDKALRYGIPAINRALEGIEGPTVVHICFGYAAVVKQQKPTGYSFLPQLAEHDRAADLDRSGAAQARPWRAARPRRQDRSCWACSTLAITNVETPETVADRIRAALKHVAPDRLIPAPDCGMKYLPRAVAFGKLQSLAEGAAIVRRELAG